MKKACILAAFLCVLIVASGCGSGNDGVGDGCEGEPGAGVFGDDCTVNDDCESCVCFVFGEGTWCTLECASDDECPVGSQGRKCNRQGYCRP